jgi:hypothetical protein
MNHYRWLAVDYKVDDYFEKVKIKRCPHPLIFPHCGRVSQDGNNIGC